MNGARAINWLLQYTCRSTSSAIGWPTYKKGSNINPASADGTHIHRSRIFITTISATTIHVTQHYSTVGKITDQMSRANICTYLQHRSIQYMDIAMYKRSVLDCYEFLYGWEVLIFSGLLNYVKVIIYTNSLAKKLRCGLKKLVYLTGNCYIKMEDDYHSP